MRGDNVANPFARLTILSRALLVIFALIFLLGLAGLILARGKYA